MSTKHTWRHRGMCTSLSPEEADELFFGDNRGNRLAQTIKTFCDRCPVRIECLTTAFEHNEYYGVWGGVTPEVRQALCKTRQRATCPDCRAPQPAQADSNQLCIRCGMSWRVPEQREGVVQ